jgi:hypothetical protein
VDDLHRIGAGDLAAVTKHRLDIEGFYPTGEAGCICGVRGNRAEVVLHVANNFHDSAPIAVADDFDSGATKAHYLPNTPRLPAPPRPPCRERGCLAPLNSAGTCVIHSDDPKSLPDLPPADPEMDRLAARSLRRRSEDRESRKVAVEPPPRAQTPTDITAVEAREEACPTCGSIDQIADLPEIAAWSCGHWIRRRPASIAEAFQDMLRGAFQAGLAAATSGDLFEIWYQREVLR